MAIQKIQKIRVGDQVFEQMKQMIADGEWRPGDKLPSEMDLADQFGISRVTVRQALQRLSALQLVETRLGEGSFVRQMDLEQAMDALIPTAYLSGRSNAFVFEFREIIETASASLAARRAGSADVAQLRELQRSAQQAAEQGRDKDFAELDLAFHFQVGEITGNPLIVRTNQILRDTLRSSMAEVIDRMGCENALRFHGAIIDAIEAHDPERASSLMAQHIGKNREYFPESAEEQSRGGAQAPFHEMPAVPLPKE